MTKEDGEIDVGEMPLLKMINDTISLARLYYALRLFHLLRQYPKVFSVFPIVP